MIKNNIEVVREKLEKVIGDYKSFKDYFYEVFNEWTEHYNLTDYNNYCEEIILDIITMSDDIVRERKRKMYYKNIEDISKEIEYGSMIISILKCYRYYNMLVNSKECINYLIENDETLEISIKLAKEKGYKIDNINVYSLANILYQFNQDKEYTIIHFDLIDLLIIFCKHYVINIHEYKMNSYK